MFIAHTSILTRPSWASLCIGQLTTSIVKGFHHCQCQWHQITPLVTQTRDLLVFLPRLKNRVVSWRCTISCPMTFSRSPRNTKSLEKWGDALYLTIQPKIWMRMPAMQPCPTHLVPPWWPCRHPNIALASIANSQMFSQTCLEPS